MTENLYEIENGVTVQRASITVKNEKELESLFCKRMQLAGWHCFPQRYNLNGDKRIDVAAYHELFKDVFFCFELKIPNALCDLTKALRQMIDYRKQKDWTYPFKVFCLFTPNDLNFIHYRYFWRWGFGVGNLDSMAIRFCNAESKSIINLTNPSYGYYQPSERIQHILKRVKDGWELYDDIY